MNKQENYKKGKEGENAALEYLQNKDFIFIEANFENELGEIDLIMADGDWLVFVEVKYKQNDLLGLPEEMITKNKLAKVKKVAESFLIQQRKIASKFEKYRIDGVCILGKEIRHYQNLQ